MAMTKEETLVEKISQMLNLAIREMKTPRDSRLWQFTISHYRPDRHICQILSE
jgi:hypothetical protein